MFLLNMQSVWLHPRRRETVELWLTRNNLWYPLVLFPRHFSPTTAEDTISRIQLFRDYLHYHIKCSKAYLHSRMRHRVSEFLKILNRAKLETTGDKERKTVRYAVLLVLKNDAGADHRLLHKQWSYILDSLIEDVGNLPLNISLRIVCTSLWTLGCIKTMFLLLAVRQPDVSGQ